MFEKAARPDERFACTDEDAELLWQATARAEEFLEHLADDKPAPADDLRFFVNYLRNVVLARVSEEDHDLFPMLEQFAGSHPEVERLREDHLTLREHVDDLVEATAPHGNHDADELAALTRRLILRLEQHLRTEAAVVAGADVGYRSQATKWAEKAHWYPLTEGSHIDLDQLPPRHADNLVLNRLAAAKAGERVELHGHGDADRLWKRLQRRAPNGYSWSPHQENDNGWTVAVTRRPDP